MGSSSTWENTTGSLRSTTAWLVWYRPNHAPRNRVDCQTEPNERPKYLFHILRPAPLLPGIVGCGEVYSFRPRRMIEEPDFRPSAGIWIGQVDFSALLKEIRRHLPLVGDNAMHNLESKAIRLVLEMTTDGVERRRGECCQGGQNEDQHRQGRRIVDAANAPTRSPPAKHPDRDPVSEIEQPEKQ